MGGIVLEQHVGLLCITSNGARLVAESESVGSSNFRANNILDITASMRTTRLDLQQDERKKN